ncbi:MAG: GTPase [Planctomycetota bacterium]
MTAVQRDNIGLFGRMNAGKSTVMNLLTQQETSIVDPTPGTTTDTRTTLMELHGLGPVKLYDTAGLDEGRALGDKKRRKAVADLKECDLVLLVIDPSAAEPDVEAGLIRLAREHDKQLLVVYNLFREEDRARVPVLREALPALKHCPDIALNAADPASRPGLIGFILDRYEPRHRPVELFPFIRPDAFYVLNIPMDMETPPGRYLRPQAMCEEYITRHYAYPVAYRMDLARGRRGDGEERRRFDAFLAAFGRRPHAVITDSQAMDLAHDWVPADILLTTFSIVMVHHQSGGGLAEFAAGVRVLDTLRPGDRILITEACNHSRVGEDIGTVQIPRSIAQRWPGVAVEHSFGREFQANEHLGAYRLVVHCGGCMLSSQQMRARVRDLRAAGVPFTNYGLFLAYLKGAAALRRVLAPWGLD